MVCCLQTVLGGHGAPGIELAHQVRLSEHVGAALSGAERAGATIVPPAPVRSGAARLEHSLIGDGYVWPMAHSLGWTIDEDAPKPNHQ